MRKLSLLLVTLLALVSLHFYYHSQHEFMPLTENYEKAWKIVDSLEQKGLPQSALKHVEAILSKAKKEQNAPQTIKAIIYRGKYQIGLEEDGLVKAIKRIDNEIKEASFPTKSILQSMQAELYHQYLQNNMWKIRDRTETEDFNSDDILTWTIGQLVERSKELYLASIADDQSKKIDISNFSIILSEGKNTEQLRPTLYDFLTHRVLDYLGNSRSHLTEPSYKFVLRDKAAFSSANEFVQLEFDTKDLASAKYQTLLLFQKLLSVHLGDKTPDALLDLDLKRLKFVYDNIIIANKEQLYEEALNDLARAYINHPSYAEINYQIADLYYQKGQNYQPNPDQLGKLDFKKAYDICEQTIDKFPNSIGAKHCKNLQANLLRKELQVEVEQVNLPESPILASISFKNVPKAFIKVVAVEYEERNGLRRKSNKAIIKSLNNRRAIQQKTIDLPQEGDYRRHRTEIDLSGLSFGYYAILISNNSEFSGENGTVGYAFTHISKLANWSRTNRSNRPEIVVVDRRSGQPLEGVMGELYQRNYNASTRDYERKKTGFAISNKDGYLDLPVYERSNFQLKLIKGEDVLFLDDNYASYFYNQPGPPITHTHFFLDRAIYRPGQTVFFKGIVIEKGSDGMPSIVPNKPLEVTFYDVNRQEVARLSLITNEYGTINGSFKAPSQGLRGSMSLASSAGGSHFFRVEEYKRPKFEVSFEPVRGSYKLGEAITIIGEAKAFAGNAIDNAKVSYRVVRKVRFPYRPFWTYRYNPYQRPDMEIANGEVTTDAAGKFTIDFEAIPDESIPEEKQPTFMYEVLVDVTDITGETQSNSLQTSVGYIALMADVAIPDKIDKNETFPLKITTTNLSGEFEPANVAITVSSLNAPNTVFKERYWDKPDVFVLSANDFKGKFPNFAWKNEDEQTSWKLGKQVYNQNIDTRLKVAWSLPVKEWSPGKYVLTMKTTDKFGQSIEVKKYFELFDLTSKSVVTNEALWLNHPNKPFEPGEQANICLASGLNEVFALLEVEKNGNLISYEWKKINGKEDFHFDITERYRGNFHYHVTFTADNRTYQTSQTVLVPWSNKELNIEYATFRDKLKPGQEEEWQIKISGPKREKVAAEMVATMYDASLDQFAVNNWNLNIFPTSNYPQRGWAMRGFNSHGSAMYSNNWQPSYVQTASKVYQRLNWFGFPFYGGGRVAYARSMGGRNEVSMMKSAAPMAEEAVSYDMAEAESLDAIEVQSDGGDNLNEETHETAGKTDFSDVKVRTNLNETVFFMPNLKTDSEGNIIIKFTMNEALTKWKFLGLATTKDLKIATTSKEIITQKELMVVPNAPRFFREGDQIEFTAKVSNLTEASMQGTAKLQLFNALTMEPIDLLLGLGETTIPFEVASGQSVPLSWKLKVPFGGVYAITHRVVAKAGSFSDGEENILPVLTNRMLVTETKPIALRGKETKTFTLESLRNAVHSTTLVPHQYTLEFSSNPAWYAVQALPYLMEYPYDCTEQVFNRFYANTLASTVANAHPKIKTIFDSWKSDPMANGAMKSNLSKNQELKSALLEETPWVLAAQSEEKQKENIGLLFDLTRMGEEQAIALEKIKERQLSNGGFAWFPGGRDSWYITQNLVEGLGHLQKLGAMSIGEESAVDNMLYRAVAYADERVVETYKELTKAVEAGRTKFEDDHLTHIIIHYLYARSFFPTIKHSPETATAFNYYVGQGEKYWLGKGVYQEGMIGLALHRFDKKEVSQDIIKSLKERALQSEELGMYWNTTSGYYWHQLPIETHALMMELFQEVASDESAVNELKIWLLKNKQTNHWKTTKATSAVVYALLMSGDNWILEDQQVDITIGKGKRYREKIAAAQQTVEAGTGYFKTSWEGELVSSDMSQIKVENPNNQPAWGAVYWQYFEDLDKIKTFKETPLTINKKLFLEVSSDGGPQIKPVDEHTPIKPGDKLKVRIEIKVDRAMEYVHLKDMRASGFEPINVLSGYKWQGAFGYYESTGDMATNFFIDYLPKGTHIFEYPLRVVHKGDFSNGITSLQCMYAPEFSSHSEGIRVTVQ